MDFMYRHATVTINTMAQSAIKLSGEVQGATASVHMFYHIDGVVSVTLNQINLPWHSCMPAKVATSTQGTEMLQAHH